MNDNQPELTAADNERIVDFVKSVAKEGFETDIGQLCAEYATKYEREQWSKLVDYDTKAILAQDERIKELEAERNEYRERLEYLSISLPLTEGYKIARESLRELLKKYQP